MVGSNPGIAPKVSKEMEGAYKDYSKAAGAIAISLARLAGLSEEAAMEFAKSNMMADTIALSLYTFTSQTLFLINANKADKGDTNGDS
jgi:hypothetical protein